MGSGRKHCVHDRSAKQNAPVEDEDSGSCDQSIDLITRLAAEGTVLVSLSARLSGHAERLDPWCRWREGRDSNSRGSFTPPTRLAGGGFRPLSHLPGDSGLSFDSIRRGALSYLAPNGVTSRSSRPSTVGTGAQLRIRPTATPSTHPLSPPPPPSPSPTLLSN